MSMRVIAGRFRGRALATPKGQATRPTLGRVRESLFGILNPWLDGARIIDLYAGSGALGIEALSRGAEFAYFVENSRPALNALHANIETLGIGQETHVIEHDVQRLINRPTPPGDKPFNIILLDPPYGMNLAAKTLEKIAAIAEAWLAPEALVVAQAGRHDALADQYGPLKQTRQSHYGDTWIAIYLFA